MVTAAAASYEEQRKQRLEENKKRMEQFNLHKLYQALKPPPNKYRKLSPVKLNKVKADSGAVTLVRRSARMSDKPPPNYKQCALVGGIRIDMRRDLFYRDYASNENRIYAIEKAEKQELRLGSEFPTFFKPLLHSHVSGGIMRFPAAFCKTHLPNHDEMLTLVDEDGGRCQIKYHLRYNGLGSGWKGFCIDHGLVDGDALVFQLIEPTTLKVYIIRANSSKEDKEHACDES